jgi:hypothetical protein
MKSEDKMEMSGLQYAATKQTWRKDMTIREIFAEIVDSNPRGSEASWRKAFLEELKNNVDALHAASDYAFDGCLRAYHSMKTHERTKKMVAKAQEKQNAEIVAEAAVIKETVILLNMEMPNGKRARNCSLDYFYRLGGAYRKIGKRGDKTLIGAKYNEAEFRAKLSELV